MISSSNPTFDVRRIAMPSIKELSIQMEDRPGTLGKMCRALAERGVNVLAFQAVPFERKSLVRLIVDSSTTAKTVLHDEGLPYTETDVSQIKCSRNKPGELARAASLLGKANININYAYAGVDPTANAPLIIFGVADAARASSILDEAGAAAA
jgi:hypothetical protein